MKKIRTITYHSAYNFGAALQAYALQEMIKKIADDYKEQFDFKIINLRTKKRDLVYDYTNTNLKNLLKNILTFNKLIKKQNNFEKFFSKYYLQTEQYSNCKELDGVFSKDDYIICGSDQIWNINVIDFEWSYYLDFCNESHKISYAPSFGQKEINFQQEDVNKIKELLLEFENISVRDKYSYDVVKKIAGIESEILIDPTLLITRYEWDNIISEKRIVKSKYILLYLIEQGKKADIIYSKVAKYAKKRNLKVVIIRPNIRYDWKYNFIKLYDSAVVEFLNLIKNAELVISTSFHGTIFSIIFNTPFFCINGLKDNRIRTLLNLTELESQSISLEQLKEDLIIDVDFNTSIKKINEEIEKSKNYLIRALNLENKVENKNISFQRQKKSTRTLK